MSSRFKFTAMELAALSVLAVVVAVSALVAAFGKRANGDGASRAAADSIAAVIEASEAVETDSAVMRKPRKIKKKAASGSPRQPRRRNYLDEPVEN